MVDKTEYKTLSKKVKVLLAREEGLDSDWKRGMNGLESEDLVAFANSKNGGSILIGVEETKDSEGRQTPKIVGSRLTDTNKMSIKTKAQNCIPPIELNIIKENTANEPFYRIEIPSGNNKPYCTQKGIYKIRADGNNKVITPDELLSMFIELESELFLKRFKTAAEELEKVLFTASDEINEAKSYLEDILPQLEELQNYSYMSEEILGHVEEIVNDTSSTEITSNWNEKRIIALLNHFEIEDPYVINKKNNFKEFITRRFNDGEDIKDEKFLKEIRNIW
jgi:ATP-dependent DNA helicase RecG